METKIIRRRFLEYFVAQQHAEVVSSPVIPHGDPSLLFTNAGMNQFKDVFLGSSCRSYTRATTSQKCIRAGGKHNDLENVGHTSRHLTFFEMIGNFSFGDYFKEEAIRFAWEVATTVFEFPEDRIWPTVFRDDDEAFDLWMRYVPAHRITRFGEKENFWAMGDVGPCGPCSELLFDRGSSYGIASCPSEDPDGERFLEFWNLVFMQYNTLSSGERLILPRPSIDTGAGLERVVSLVNGVSSVYETDILRGLISAIERLSDVVYDPMLPSSAAFRVIADHIRSLAFSIADGAQPGNVDRGYVLRKILRRAVRYGRQLGFNTPFLAALIPDLIHCMGDTYPELQQARHRIEEIVTLEEESFCRTLRRGGSLLSAVIDASHHSSLISGEDAFMLKDTYGLPLEEISLIAIDHGCTIDTERFLALEEEARQRSRGCRQQVHQVATSSCYEQFLAHTIRNDDSTVIACLQDGVEVPALMEGEKGSVILSKTPFYAERGGQVGDQGYLCSDTGVFDVHDVQTPYPGIIEHHGVVRTGRMQQGMVVVPSLHESRHQAIARHHTATHLLHAALIDVLGPHVRQAGSYIDEHMFRFDFSHHRALSQEELYALEDRVHAWIRENHAVSIQEMSLEEAQKRPDIKQFFGEKYGACVRVVAVGPSQELCGGSHVSHTGTLGTFAILKEESIATGTRRIEACAGEAACRYQRSRDQQLHRMADALHTSVVLVEERLQHLIDHDAEQTATCKRLRREYIRGCCAQLSKSGHVYYGVLPCDDLNGAIEEASALYPQSILIIATVAHEKASIAVKVPAGFVQQGMHAQKIVRIGLAIMQGKGGGKETYAQGSGSSERLHEALQAMLVSI